MHAQRFVLITTSAHIFNVSALFLWIKNSLWSDCWPVLRNFLASKGEIADVTPECYGTIWASLVLAYSSPGSNLSTGAWRSIQFNLFIRQIISILQPWYKASCCCGQPTNWVVGFNCLTVMALQKCLEWSILCRAKFYAKEWGPALAVRPKKLRSRGVRFPKISMELNRFQGIFLANINILWQLWVLSRDILILGFGTTSSIKSFVLNWAFGISLRKSWWLVA